HEAARAGGRHPLEVAENVLEEKRNTVEGAAAGRLTRRSRASLVEHLVDDRVERGVVLLDATDGRFNQLGRRDVLFGHQLGQTESVELTILRKWHIPLL